MSLRVRVDGFREFQDFLRTAPENLHRDLDRLMEDTAKDVHSSARSRVHVVTGRLRESIRWMRDAPLAFRVEAAAPYGVFEEERGDSHRFMAPSVVSGKSLFRRRLQRLSLR